MKRLSRILLISAIAALVAACSSGEGELNRYINKIKSRPARPIEPIPEFAPLPKFVYPEDVSRRSPFVPITKKLDLGSAPDKNRPRDPLEAFPLDALKFVGILKEGALVWGLIQQPDDKIVRVRAGQYMGQNYGQVTSINDKRIKLVETVQIGGKWTQRNTEISIDTKD